MGPRAVALNGLLIASGPGYRRAGLSVYAEGLINALLGSDESEPECLAIVPRGVGNFIADGRGGRVIESDVEPHSVAHRIVWEQSRLSSVAARHGASLTHGLAGVVNLSGLPAIATIHDLAFMVGSRVHGGLQRAYLTAAARLTARRARCIIVPSQSTGVLVCERLGVPPERVKLVPHGIPDGLTRPAMNTISAFRSKHGLRKPYVLYLGTVEPRKGVNDLIHAYAQLSKPIRGSHDLVIAGAQGWGTDQARRAAADSGIESHVRWLGYIADDEAPAALAGAEVFCYPSHHEGFGLPVAEAMRCGAAIVTTNATSMPEVIGDAGIMVAPGSPEALSVALADLLQNAERRAELGAAAISRSKRYSWAEVARQTRRVYSEVLADLPR